ncbi:glycosyltransferase [Legionella cincinnatiensis]|uniref:Bacteriophage N4 adsorption protein B n=1 Tax=Legionella cincinnatiensis TaxID=28085 RepID=A0A378IWN8_9GAMM|nr:glycosyltransferase [Legionella cincinnatiensis]KTC78448.1 bacteriophage N4 adsorption protein B [Legionella cincinnatiensis]STX36434.1 bacteriophage N4 adsorption protein B [Legionella cincinnatiensis]
MDLLFFWMWYFLMFAAVFFFISGLDDFFIDLVYWIYFPWRRLKMKKYTPLNLKQLFEVPEQRIALMIACWHEPAIANMLRYNLDEIKYENYDIFIGVYSNDPDTVAVIREVQDIFPNIFCVFSPLPGPTTKAKNLNSMYKYIQNREQELNIKYEIFVMHDTEDVIDPLSFKLYNYVIPRKDMVQLPVVPLPISMKYITHWTYNDEFAEIHTKDLVVRELLHGFIPSAGVGTGFSRKALETLALHNNGEPFSLFSLTEDYSCALKLKVHRLNTIFMTFWVKRIVSKPSLLFWGKTVYRTKKMLVATRSLRVMEYSASVRQRTRWTIGIAFQEWYYSGWPGSFAIKYTLFHDRKATISHIVNMCGYVLFIFWFIFYIYSLFVPGYLTLEMMLHLNPWVWYLIVADTFFMIDRILQRVIGVYRVYGLLPALTCPFRTIYSNILYAHVLIRAYSQFFIKHKPKVVPKWDKTDNFFPGPDLLAQYELHVGDLLIEKHQIKTERLVHALKQQKETGEKIGKILIKNKDIDEETLLSVLALQYNMQLVRKKNLPVLHQNQLAAIPTENYYWLLDHHCLLISIDEGIVSIGLEDIPDKQFRNEIRHRVAPLRARLLLLY